MKERLKHLLLFILLIAIDQLTKYWVKTDLLESGPIIIIPDVFRLQYHTNNGAVWGLMSGKVDFLKIFTFLVLLLIVYFYFKIPKDKKYNALKYIVVFIMAGAVGNLIDRMALGYVIDFIYFELINFPLFNIADTYLTVSSALLLILAFFYYKDDDFAFIEQLFKKRNVEATKQENSSKEEDTITEEEDEDTDLSDEQDDD